MNVRISSSVASIFILVLGCERTPLEPAETDALPTVNGIYVRTNPNAGLGAITTVVASNGATAAVEVWSDSVLVQTTPSVSVQGDSATVPTLGLRADKTYALRAVVVSSSGRAATSTPFGYPTPSLPNTIPQFTVLSSRSPTVRFVLLGITPARDGKSCAVIIDSEGHPVWYKELQDAVVDFQKQPNGCYTAWSSVDGSPSHFYEFDKLGEITNSYRSSNGLETGPHELRMSGQSYALFGIQFRIMDLSAWGGLPNATVRGLVVEYHRPGQMPFLWSTFDHFAVADAVPDVALDGQNVNPWHGNAIEIDGDGHLLVSFRNMDETTKINSITGEIIWRLGGKRNEFTFRNDNLNGFSHQHGVRRLANGNIILFDNGNLHVPPVSRAVEYKLDESGKVAELVWEYRPDPSLFGFALGFAQRLANGNTLISFGTAQRIMEIDRDGTKRWELEVSESQRYAYRALAIDSLY